MAKKKDFEVGYGKPPQHSRFKPGKSGNPKGRPKPKPTLSELIMKALQKTVTVTVDGKRIKLTKLEAAATQLANKAASGDRHAINVAFNQTALSEQQKANVSHADRVKADEEMLKRLMPDLFAEAESGKDDDEGGANE